MIKRMTIMLLACALVFGGVFGFKMFGMKMMMQAMAAMGDPTHTVSTTKVSKQAWQSEIKIVGSLRAAKGADLSPETAGTVENVFMESGQDVEEGTVLMQLRSHDEIAKLQSLIAQTRLAELTVERNAKMIASGAIAQAQVDADIATLESLKAQIEEQKAQLAKKTITAPFSGRLGIRQVDVGQFIQAGTNVVTLQQVDPLYLDFFVPQQDVARLQVGQKIAATTNSFAGQVFEGEITALGAKIDEKTRNIDVRASFKNPDKKLLPGMFAAATLATGEPQQNLTLPQTAITFNPYGNTVYIVKKEKTEKGEEALIAKMAFVETGATRGDQVVIVKGVTEGDEVVIAGQMKLRNGAKVTVNNNVIPKSDAAPSPRDQ